MLGVVTLYNFSYTNKVSYGFSLYFLDNNAEHFWFNHLLAIPTSPLL